MFEAVEGLVDEHAALEQQLAAPRSSPYSRHSRQAPITAESCA